MQRDFERKNAENAANLRELQTFLSAERNKFETLENQVRFFVVTKRKIKGKFFEFSVRRNSLEKFNFGKSSRKSEKTKENSERRNGEKVELVARKRFVSRKENFDFERTEKRFSAAKNRPRRTETRETNDRRTQREIKIDRSSFFAERRKNRQKNFFQNEKNENSNLEEKRREQIESKINDLTAENAQRVALYENRIAELSEQIGFVEKQRFVVSTNFLSIFFFFEQNLDISERKTKSLFNVSKNE